MNILQYTLTGLVALIHIYIMILEMVLWTKPKGIETFGLQSKDFAIQTKVLAANQGLYNGFLAAGLIWAMYTQKIDVAIFFLTCVFVAGLYGSYSTKNLEFLLFNLYPL